MDQTQAFARQNGYVETFLGTRRHIPDMQLKPFEFEPMRGYINPDIDPLDVSALEDSDKIPEKKIRQLEAEFAKMKYFGQTVKRTKELYEENIKVINNTQKITEATRQCVNCVDTETEILTANGWKRYDQITEGDEILSYSLDDQQIVHDSIKAVHIYPGKHQVAAFETPTFSAVSTFEHRWVVGEADEAPRIKLTSNIYKNKWPDYPILRVGDNSFEPNSTLSDDELKVLGWIMTDGNIGGPHYCIHLYQSTKKEKNAQVYQDMIATLGRLGFEFTDSSRDGFYHEIYLKQNHFTDWVYRTFSNRTLTFGLVSTLSQHQAEVLMRAMLQGDGTGVDGTGAPLRNSTVTLVCSSEAKRDVFQYLCFVAGYATNSKTVDPTTTDAPSNHIQYESIGNIPECKNIYYEVTVLRVQRAHIYDHHKSTTEVDTVWCVTTSTGTWIARRDGKVYITGNSVIQGSAAMLTKMAILRLETNSRWKEIGGRFIIPVHDELICEVPIEYADEGAQILSSCMEDAGAFMELNLSCDVEMTYAWYGLEAPCPYPKPSQFTDIEALTEDEIKWVQYMLHSTEYHLPVYKDADGNKPRGDAAYGVNGIWSKEVEEYVFDFCKLKRVPFDQFCDVVERRVVKGE